MDATGSEARRVAVIGAGITGLATAFLLSRARPDWHVEVFEAADALGGKARTSVRDGYTVDWGPNGFLAAPGTLALVHDVGLTDALQPASAAARHRFLYRDGGLRPLPTTPQAFLTSEVVPFAARARAALEPWLGGRATGTVPGAGGGEAGQGHPEESVHAFLARHFGRGLADALADVFVSGIAAGDPRELSVDALFPRLRAMERAHGSLLRALLAQRRAAGRRRREAGAGAGAAGAGASGAGARESGAVGAGAAAGVLGRGGRASGVRESGAPDSGAVRLTSFREGGMQRLPDALAGALSRPVRLGADVRGLERAPEGGRYRVRVRGAEPEAFDAVVVTAPAPAAAALLRPLAPAAADALAAIPYAGVRVFGLGFDRIDVPRALGGFGFLVPRSQGVRSLGVLWTSALYPDRAPAGKVLLRVLAGGRLDPAMLELSDEDALAAVRRDLRLTMGVVADPELVETVRWPQAVPQYTLGHARRLRAVDEALAALPGLHLAGNAYRGVGINDCVREARRVVAALTGA